MADAPTAPVLDEVTGTWTVDKGHSTLGFSVKHMMFTTVRGVFTELEGSFTVNEDGSGEAQARIDAASINTNTPDRDAHLKSGDFLDVENHPELTFKSTSSERVSDNQARLSGDLTVRGTTRPVTLDVSFNGILPKDLYGMPRASFSATTTVNRKDFGLVWNQALETGGFLIGDEVTLELEIAAVQQGG